MFYLESNPENDDCNPLVVLRYQQGFNFAEDTDTSLNTLGNRNPRFAYRLRRTRTSFFSAFAFVNCASSKGNVHYLTSLYLIHRIYVKRGRGGGTYVMYSSVSHLQLKNRQWVRSWRGNGVPNLV